MPQEKWYNILTDTLPDSVEVCGKKYPILTNFKDWISFFLLHEDKSLTDVEKVHISMNWYIGRPDNMIAAYQALQEFAACKSLPKAKGTGTSAPVFSYLHDSPYLFADFLRFYQINLQTAQLHWFAFNALFEGMPEDSSTKQRIAYRSVNLGTIKDKKERARLAKIQRAVAIPRPPMTAEEVGNLFG